jgi:Arc/MetJ family transcription regulator
MDRAKSRQINWLLLNSRAAEWDSSVSRRNVYVRGNHMAAKRSSIRLDADLVDEAAKILGAKSRSEAVDLALQQIVALKRFKKLMKKQAGKLSFDGYME